MQSRSVVQIRRIENGISRILYIFHNSFINKIRSNQRLRVLVIIYTLCGESRWGGLLDIGRQTCSKLNVAKSFST